MRHALVDGPRGSAVTELKTALAGRMPWWLVVAIGAACVALGGVLIADPFRSLTVLAWLAAATLVVAGVAELASSGAASQPWLARVAGVVWIVGGVLAVAWPGLTIRAVAITVGIALIVGGAARILAAVFGRADERFAVGLSGLTSVLFGLLALSWPDVTVLSLAVLFGVATVVFGFGQIAVGLRLRGAEGADPWSESRRWPRTTRVIGTVVVCLLALGGVATSVAIDRASPAAPGEFYAAPSPLPEGPPGTIIHSEIVNAYRAGATTYRVLYKSTGYDGEPAAVSGMIFVPDGEPPPGGRRVVEYTHGTVGVASNCAPSLATSEANPVFFEGGEALLEAGYVIAASDYQGLGTPGPHPYLVGESAAMNGLDSVRAARNLADVRAGADFVVWGHSQGGHASLFSGHVASAYAPELRLLGVAAGAPVPNLVDLFRINIETRVGKILIAMALRSWEQVYDDADLDQIATPASRPSIARIARNCLYNPRQILASVPSALVLGLTFLHSPVWDTEPWRTIADENTPGATPIGAPVLVLQGGADQIVDPQVTEWFVEQLCAKGETAALQTYPGVGHLETGHDAAPDVVTWVADRFAGKPPPTTCGS